MGIPGRDVRLYDWLTSSSFSFKEGGDTPIISGLRVFEISPFYNFVRKTKSDWNLGDLNLAPPFSDFFVEYVYKYHLNIPVVIGARITNSRVNGKSHDSGFLKDQEPFEMGWIIHFRLCVSKPLLISSMLNENVYKTFERAHEDYLNHDGEKRHPQGGMISEWRERLKNTPEEELYERLRFNGVYWTAECDTQYYIFLDKFGQPKGYMLFYGRLSNPIPVPEQQHSLFNGLAFPIWMALSYLNLPRNLQETKYPRQMRKKLKSDETIPCTYYVLKIPEFEKYMRATRGVQNISSVRLHTRRGNWAIYSPEAPLFGRLIGTFWRQEAICGNRDFGKIEKDYQIEPSRAEIEAIS